MVESGINCPKHLCVHNGNGNPPLPCRVGVIVISPVLRYKFFKENRLK